MGLIKTAIMSDVAMYGINQISKAAARSRNSDTGSSRGSPYRDYEQHYPRAVESNNRCYADNRYLSSSRDTQDQARFSSYYTNELTWRLYLEGQALHNGAQQYYDKEQLDSPPRYEYPGNTRSTSAPPLQFNYSSNRQRGFMEPEETMGDPREPQGADRPADNMNMFAQQAMDMGLEGNNSGGKDKKTRGDLVQSLMRK